MSFTPIPTPKSTSESGCSRYCPWIRRIIFGILFLTGLAVGISYIWTGSNPIEYFQPTHPPGLKEAIRWDAVSGLELIVENACDDTWIASFEIAIADWDQTDALALTTQKVSHDPECSVSYGRLKICNGDYGDTSWRGINSSVLKNDVIAYSTSRLNDFHLKSADQKRYTMCHEMGHGFGLPHTDEDHFNRDRGDCMDYTNRPGQNLVPGEFNLSLLEQLYGTPSNPTVVSQGLNTVGITTQISEQGNLPPVETTSMRPDPNNNDKKKPKNVDDRSRTLRRGGQRRVLAVVNALEDSCEAENCSVDLGDGYRLEIHKLLV